MRYLLILLLLGLPACAPSLGDDDDATADDDATGDDDETADDDDATGDDDDTSPGADDDDIGDDDDDSWTPCDEVITALGPDEESPLGFSGDDVVAPIAGPLIATATWSGTGATTDVSFALSVSGDPLFHDLSEPEDPPQGPDFQCLDWLEIPVTALFETADGGFDEILEGSLRQDEQGGPWLNAELDWENLGGTFVFTEIDPADWDEVGLDLSNGWVDTTMSGQVSLSASREPVGGVGEGMVGPVLMW